MILLDSKSAPLDIWAFIILSVSSRSVGINLRAIVIIIASSWAGKPIFLSGPQAFSIPSVSSIGDVVSVKRDVATTNNVNLMAINIAVCRPLSLIFKNPNCQSIWSP